MRKLLLPVLAVLLITALGCGKNNRDGEQKNGSAVNEVRKEEAPVNNIQAGNKKAPAFTLTSTDGKKVSLSDYKGKVVILDFWATWCPPCRKGIPDLISLQKEYKDKVVVIGVSLDTDSKKDVVPFSKKIGINYPVVYGDENIVHAYGDIQSIPTTFIIDKEGNIAANYVGLVEKSAFTSVIEKL